MTDAEILDLFRRIRSWNRGDERAPHKPLLLLLALAQLQRGGARWLTYAEVEPRLRELLEDYLPERAAQHPEYPFWRLRNDGIWEIREEAAIRPYLTAAGDAPPRLLRDCDARGGFTETLLASLSSRRDLVDHIAREILDRTFPPSLHESILDACGFPEVPGPGVQRRDPEFRDMILRIYEHRCSVCGYDGRLGRSDLGIEAAHIKWHAAGGPDLAANGLAMCVLHHVALDRGAITLSDDLRILVSQEVHGGPHVDEWLVEFAGRPARPPLAGEPPPAPDYLAWHRREVFREPPRRA
jgi:putative restriction endonuclease